MAEYEIPGPVEDNWKDAISSVEEIIEDAPTFRYKSERVKRTRVLRDGEIRTLWHACDAAPLRYFFDSGGRS